MQTCLPIIRGTNLFEKKAEKCCDISNYVSSAKNSLINLELTN